MMTRRQATLACAAAFTAFASETGLDKVRLLRVPEGGLQPQAMLDDRGVLHLIYFSGDPSKGDVFYAQSTNNGAAFSSPLRVNSQPGSAIALGTIRGAQLAIGKNGRVHVAWNGSSVAEPHGPVNPDSGKSGAPMLYSRLNLAGTAFEPQRNLMLRSFGLDGGGSLAADPAGNVYVAWHGIGEHEVKQPGREGEARRRVWLTRSNDDGSSFATEAHAWERPTGACGCCGMKIFAGPNGNITALYRSATESVHRDFTCCDPMTAARLFRAGCSTNGISTPAHEQHGYRGKWQPDGRRLGNRGADLLDPPGSRRRAGGTTLSGAWRGQEPKAPAPRHQPGRGNPTGVDGRHRLAKRRNLCLAVVRSRRPTGIRNQKLSRDSRLEFHRRSGQPRQNVLNRVLNGTEQLESARLYHAGENQNPGQGPSIGKNMQAKYVLGSGALAVALCLGAAALHPPRQRTYAFHYENVLGTSLELKVAAAAEADAGQAEKVALREIDREAKILSAWDSGSEFSRWERTSGQAVPVSAELFEVLGLFDQWRERTGGALDALAEAVTRVWKQAEARQTLPSEQELNDAVWAVQRQHWRLDPASRTATHLSTTPLALNSFAKSYIAGRAAVAALAQPAVRQVVVNIGGDIVIRGAGSEHVDIADPKSDAENAPPIASLEIHDRAIATSGNYRRGVEPRCLLHFPKVGANAPGAGRVAAVPYEGDLTAGR